MNDFGDFTAALLASPLGVVLVGRIEASVAPDPAWFGTSLPVSTPATVDAAVEAVHAMSFGEFLLQSIQACQTEAGPWIGDAPRQVAAAYHNAPARQPIAEAITARFGDVLHTPLERTRQQWWASGWDTSDRVEPRFGDLTQVYAAGQFAWDTLWTVTDPPEEVHDHLVAAWEFFGAPVTSTWLPVSPTARVFEVHRPEDWARLVLEHPRPAGPHPEWELPGINQRTADVAALEAVPCQRGVRRSIRRHLVPDWTSVAEQYDGVHLSWAGYLTSEGCITDVPGGDVTLLRYWFSERTLWLADVFGEPAPAPAPTLGDWHGLDDPEPREQLGPLDAVRLALGRSTGSTGHE